MAMLRQQQNLQGNTSEKLFAGCVSLKPGSARALVKEIALIFSRKGYFVGANRSYDMLLLEVVKCLCRTILLNKQFVLDISMISFEGKRANMGLKQNILSVTPAQRKALGINKSTLWYQKKAALEGRPFKVYEKPLSKLRD